MSTTTQKTTGSTESGQELRLIYPIHFIVRSQSIWMAWQSVDEPNEAVLKDRDAVLWGETRHALVAMCLQKFSNLSIEDDVVFDLDTTLLKLSKSQDGISDEVINSWNILRDVKSSLAPEVGGVFQFDSDRLVESYDRFFSMTAGGEILDIGERTIFDKDVRNAVDVISTGMTMLLHITETSLSRRGIY